MSDQEAPKKAAPTYAERARLGGLATAAKLSPEARVARAKKASAAAKLKRDKNRDKAKKQAIRDGRTPKPDPRPRASRRVTLPSLDVLAVYLEDVDKAFPLGTLNYEARLRQAHLLLRLDEERGRTGA